MDQNTRRWAEDTFSRDGKEFEPVLVFEDDTFFVMDWRDKNGSGYLATRYIVDKPRGDLIIKGDAGCCIASWNGRVTVEHLVQYINDAGYFLGKIRCTERKYTHAWEDVKEDLESEKQAYLKKVRDGDLKNVTEQEINEDFRRMEHVLDGSSLDELYVYPESLVDFMGKYNLNWWESGVARFGRRIDKGIYLWIYGFQEGVERLRGREFVRKDI